MLSLYADFPAQFDTGTPLLVTIDALEVPLYCERFERRGTSGAVASFADFDTERRAQELVGLEFRIECDEDEDDEAMESAYVRWKSDSLSRVIEEAERCLDEESRHEGR